MPIVEVEAARDAIIIQHMYQENKTWVCADCGYAQYNKRSVTEHVESKHLEFGQDYVCGVCSKALKTRKALRRHTENYHNH